MRHLRSQAPDQPARESAADPAENKPATSSSRAIPGLSRRFARGMGPSPLVLCGGVNYGGVAGNGLV